MDAERAHRLAVNAFKFGAPLARLARFLRILPHVPAASNVQALGRVFSGPVGLAAGMDKNAEAVVGFIASGFSHVEIGTVTALGQPGNEKPRSWRELDIKGLRNRMGFNNEGADAVARRLSKLRSTRAGAKAIIGVNIGKSKVTEPQAAPADYAYSARALAPYADYLVVNVSSPNTPGLRDLQSVESLRPILEQVRAAADSASPSKTVPLLVKIAPDLADQDVDAIGNLALDLGLEGVVAVNTTIAHDRGPGGVSGPVVFPRAIEVVTRLRAVLGEGPVIIGVGGVTTIDDARAMLAAGANLIQGYTAFVYHGPWWPGRINRALSRPE